MVLDSIILSGLRWNLYRCLENFVVISRDGLDCDNLYSNATWKATYEERVENFQENNYPSKRWKSFHKNFLNLHISIKAFKLLKGRVKNFSGLAWVSKASHIFFRLDTLYEWISMLLPILFAIILQTLTKEKSVQQNKTFPYINGKKRASCRF